MAAEWGKLLKMSQMYKVPLVLTPQPEGGYTVTSPLLPELLTEGDTVEEVMAGVGDALDAVIELYEDLKRPLPASLRQSPEGPPISFECLLASR